MHNDGWFLSGQEQARQEPAIKAREPTLVAPAFEAEVAQAVAKVDQVQPAREMRQCLHKFTCIAVPSEGGQQGHQAGREPRRCLEVIDLLAPERVRECAADISHR